MDSWIGRRHDFVATLGYAPTVTSMEGTSTIADWLNISHELRTPAHAILGHVDLLLSGTMGPLSHDMRASLGDIQEAGLGLLVQIEQAIKTGQQLSWPPSSSPEVDVLVDLLDQAWGEAETAPDAIVSVPSLNDEEQQRRPARWLRVVATLLHDLGATQPNPAHASTPSMSTCMCDTDHSRVSELRLECSVTSRSDFSICITLIEAALMMTGGMLDHELGQLVLTWPERKFQLHSERVIAQPAP